MIHGVDQGLTSDSGDDTDRAEAPMPSVADGAPLRVLFVCTANICRSAYAEVAARHLLGASVAVSFSSAGTHGLPAQPLNRDIGEFLPGGSRPRRLREQEGERRAHRRR